MGLVVSAPGPEGVVVSGVNTEDVGRKSRNRCGLVCVDSHTYGDPTAPWLPSPKHITVLIHLKWTPLTAFDFSFLTNSVRDFHWAHGLNMFGPNQF